MCSFWRKILLSANCYQLAWQAEPGSIIVLKGAAGLNNRFQKKIEERVEIVCHFLLKMIEGPSYESVLLTRKHD